MVYLELYYGLLKVYVVNCVLMEGILILLFNVMILLGFKN